MVRARMSAVVESDLPLVDENAGYPGPVPQSQLAANLESHIADTLAGSGELPAAESPESPSLKIHHDEPTVDPTLAERIRIPFPSPDVAADLYIRECDGTVCVLHNGEHVLTIEDQLSRHGAISEALSAYYRKLIENGTPRNRLLAAELNAYIAKNIDDPTKIVPAGEACEWPLVDEEPPTDESTTDSDINDDGDVECKADTPSSASPTDEFPNLVPLADGQADPTAVEIVAVAEGEGAASAAAGAADQACGEVGVVGLREVDAEELLAIEKAQHLYHRAHTTAKDSYVAASQYRVQLQGDVKQAKDEEAKLLEEIGRIENRGWRAFLPEKSKPAPTADTPAPSIPSPPSTLPPPSPESTTPSPPQAGAAGAATSEAPAANGTGYRDDWESVDIAELKLPKGTTTILREAGCGTMGALEKKRGSFDGLTSIAGIGETKRDAIEEAILGWLSKHRDASAINAVREANHRAAVEGEGLALEMAAQGQ